MVGPPAGGRNERRVLLQQGAVAEQTHRCAVLLEGGGGWRWRLGVGRGWGWGGKLSRGEAGGGGEVSGN